MSARNSTGRRSSLLAVAFAAVLAIPAFAQTTTVIVKESPPPPPPPPPSAAECSARAERAAMDTVGVAGGAVRGGVGGAAVGAIVGDNRRSVGRGAAIGAVVGGTVGAVRRNDVYRRVYDDCMSGR